MEEPRMRNHRARSASDNKRRWPMLVALALFLSLAACHQARASATTNLGQVQARPAVIQNSARDVNGADGPQQQQDKKNNRPDSSQTRVANHSQATTYSSSSESVTAATSPSTTTTTASHQNAPATPTPASSAPFSGGSATTTRSSMAPNLAENLVSVSPTTTTTSVAPPPLKSQEATTTKTKQQQQQQQQQGSKARQFASSHTKTTTAKAPDNRQQQQQQQLRDPIDQMSTSQSVSFAEPTAANQEEQQAASSSNTNRWTHFGARLRPLNSAAPLTTTKDHRSAPNHVAAEQREHVVHMQRPAAASHQRQLQSNQLSSSAHNAADDPSSDSGEADLADQDDQDNEALLYKMMQQQGLLTSSMWPQPKPRDENTDPQSTAARRQGNLHRASTNANSNNNSGNRVIKLLKSYSHIHQVDDSDDQIRGTYTKLRPAQPNPMQKAASAWQSNQASNRRQQQQRQQQQQSGQPNGARQRAADRHIFVSAQPLASTRTNFNEPEPSQPEVAEQPQHKSFAAAQMNSGANNNNNNNNNNLSSGDDEDDGPPAAMAAASNQPDGGESGDSDGSSGGAPPGGEDEFECPNNGIFADEPSGCQAYHVCQTGAQVQEKFQCPLGTLFNNIILTCDFAHNVQCGSAKNKPQVDNSADSFGSNDQVRQPVPVQQPAHHQQQASIQVQAARERPAPVYQSRAQPRQYQQQQQPAPAAPGPRRLQIGSQYIPRQQQQAPPRTQAVSAYPPSPAPIQSVPLSQPDSGSANDDDSDTDNEPVVPLVPATLPPRTMAASSQLLPYNLPPPVAAEQAPPRAQQQQQQQQQYRQTAHRSQYPSHQQQPSPGYQTYQTTPQLSNYLQQQQQANAQASFFSGASHDEPASSASPVSVISDGGDTNAQAFNLVINHGAPTRQAARPVAPAKPSNVPSDNNNKRLVAIQRQQQQQQQQQYSATRQGAAQSRAPSVPHHHQHHIQKIQRTSPARIGAPAGSHLSNGRQQQQQSATQTSVAHADAPSRQVAKAALVDLTNQADSASSTNPSGSNQLVGGISAEALNDGMLLVVRHGGSQPSSIRLGDTRLQQDYGKQLKQLGNGKPAAVQQQQQQQQTGQAYAVDPAIVRPNSPIDAQLFPNVQRVLASSQQQQQQQPQASSSTQFVQHAERQSQQPSQASLISQPLPRLEPPKPNLNQQQQENRSIRQQSEQQQLAIHQKQQQHQQHQYQGEQLKSVASTLADATSKPTATTTPTTAPTTATATATAITSTSSTNKRASQELSAQQKAAAAARAKRNKRLKPVPSPPSAAATSKRPETATALLEVMEAASSPSSVINKPSQARTIGE